MSIPCSVEILTRNSEKTLERCLESVKDCAEVIILDGNSTDRTLEIAKLYGCKIYKQYDTDEPNILIQDYSEIRNKGLALASYDWFMYIDSDEYLSQGAVAEVRSIVENPNPSAYVFWQPRKYIVDGKIIDCATTYPNQQPRLFHKKFVEGFIKPVHEKIKVKAGVPMGILKGFEYVPEDSIQELHVRWARYMRIELEMAEGVSTTKLLRFVCRHSALFLFYVLRYFRNLFFCRGNRMPLRYEYARHIYTLRLVGGLIARLLRS